MIDWQKYIDRCDLTIFCALCGMIWFIPISAALVEWMFGICLIAFLIKRSLSYRQQYAQTDSTNQSPRGGQSLKSVLKYLKPADNHLNKPLFLFVLAAVLSAVFGIRPSVSFQSIVFKVLQNLFTAFFFVEAVNSRKRLKIFLGIFLASIMLININGIYQYIVREDFIRHRVVTDGRVLSSFRHPNDFASYLTVVIPVLFSLSVIQFLNLKVKRDVFLEREDSSGFFSSPYFLGICFFLLCMSVISLGLTFSRGGWLACGLALFCLVYKRPKLLILYLVLGLLFGGIFVVKMVNERTTNIGGSYKSVFFNTSDRGSNWSEALSIIKERPVFGVGLNNYTRVAFLEKFRRPEYPHNCYLQIAAEMGLVGLLSFFWVFWSLFKAGGNHLKQLKEYLSYHLHLGVMAGLGAFLIQSFFDTNFYSTQLTSYMWLTIGVMLAIPKIELKN
ncbi:MAG: O-antigen ligase family protein [Candidatus Omnitrophota bacterium]